MTAAFRYRLWGTGREARSVEDYRRLARRAVPRMVWAYIDGGAEDMRTVADNRSAFDRWRLRQRVLTGYPARDDLSVTVAGETLELPVILSPTGLTGMTHWTGEAAVARGAERAGTRMVLSSAATYSVEEVAAGAREHHWFQLYPWRDRELMGSLMARAERVGVPTLVVTVDVPIHGGRELELRHGMATPPVLTPARVLDAAVRPRWWYGFFRYRRVTVRHLEDEGGVAAAVRSVKRQAGLIRVDLGWDDVAWMRDQWRGRMFVKGILDPEDAARAMDVGADGVLVSNHGGRQLDGAVASLDALPGIAAAVRGRGEVLMDGGVRRGSDIVKALCLGADAVCIGRPFLYGLAARGEDGVVDVLRILRAELARTMTMMGVHKLGDLDATWLVQTGGGR
ncbi:MAG TPA: alpha-hydroxy acid oxidase [Acidimicrobiales bacterium]|nr:alpha-hydroxy acid oxidase [Acidimicrobiales bacterium]